MSHPPTSTHAIQNASIRWDESGQPISDSFDDIYFSKQSGIEETRYVFIEQNNLAARWAKLEKHDTFTIAETGFGTGLNFLTTWKAWQDRKTAAGFLHFISVEKFPLKHNDLVKALGLFPELQSLAENLAKNYPPQPISGIHRIQFSDNVFLTLIFDEASKGFNALLCPSLPDNCALSFGGKTPYVNAWYLDGFAPSKNPEMWTASLFSTIKNLSQEGTTFSTFTAASVVRKGLEQFGFKCKKVKGFGKKREQLTGCLQTKNDTAEHSEKHNTFWLGIEPKQDHSRSVAIIGGGLAGCHTAFSLAQRGVQVSLFEKNGRLATQASGNKQGAVYTKLSPHNNPLCLFNLSAQIYANHFYHHHNFFDEAGEKSGVFHLAKKKKDRDLYIELARQLSTGQNFLQWIDQNDTKNKLGIELAAGGLFIPDSGWLNPAKLCQALVNHPNITIHTNANIKSIARQDAFWHLLNTKNEVLHSSDQVVITNALDALSFSQTQFLPIKAIRGQVSHIQASACSSRLKHTICGEGYITPAQDQQHCIGATFTLHDDSDSLTHEEHIQNINKITNMIPSFGQSIDQARILGGKIGFRCTTPDYFPITGPVPIYQNLIDDFAPLKKNANRIIEKPAQTYPGLYCNLGFGSKGLAYAPLLAELLSSIICHQHLPVSRTLYKHLHPARFIIKDLMRNKI